MPQRSPLSLKRSLLSYAIAAAAAGIAADAHAVVPLVDVCSGNAATTISTDESGKNCTVDVAGATLTITDTGILNRQVSVNVTDATVSNAGEISRSISNGPAVTAYGINAGNLGAGASISNAGTVSFTLESTSASALGKGIATGALTGGAIVTNSGSIAITAEGRNSATAYGAGDLAYGTYDDGHLANAAGGVITVSATSHAGSTSAGAGAYGLYTTSRLVNGSSISNAGTIDVSATGGWDDIAFGINNYYGIADSSISNSGDITVSASGHYARAFGLDTYSSANGNASVTNSGTIDVSAHGDGSFAMAIGLRTNDLFDLASVSNSGSISASSSNSSGNGRVYGLSSGSLNDSASITNTAAGTLSATITANTWASAYGIAAAALGGNSVIDNSGTITASATSTHSSASAYGISTLSLTGNASVSNSGSVSATVSVPSSQGFVYGIAAGALGNQASVTNAAGGTLSASIHADGWASAYGMKVGIMDGSSLLGNAGTISASATSLNNAASAFGMSAADLHTHASIVNSGSVTASVSALTGDTYVYGIDAGALYDESSISNGGNIMVSGSATGHLLAYGIHVDRIDQTGFLDNSGAITVGATSVNDRASAYGLYAGYVPNHSSISNSGSIVLTSVAQGAGQYAYAYGMGTWEWQATTGFTQTNSGDISASATGDYASAYGMHMSGWMNTGLAINNSGTITTTSTGGNGTWASAYGIYAYGDNHSNSFSNSGTIRATATGTGSSEWVGARAIDVRGDLFQDGVLLTGTQVTNSGVLVASATSVNHSASAYGIATYNLYEGSTVSNSGTITASASGSNWAGAYGISTGTVSSGTGVSNDGVITVSTTLTGSATGSAYGLSIGSLDAGGAVVNTGNITASGNAGVKVFGIYAGGGAGSVVNNGSVNGGVGLYGTVSLDNAGNLILTTSNASHVGGNYTQGADGVLTTPVKSAASFGRLDVTGTADFSAGNRLVLALDPNVALANGDVLNNVVTAGTLTLPAAGLDIVDPSQFWAFRNVGDATSVDLAVSQVSAVTVFGGAGIAFTGSQLDLVNNLINGSVGAPYTGLATLLNAAPSAAAAAALVEQLNPALSGSASRAALAASGGIGTLIDARQAETGAASGDAFTQNGVWLKTFIGNADQDAVAGVNGFSADTTGFVLGVDSKVGDAWRLGVAAASASTDADDVYSALSIDTLQFTVYGNYAISDSTALDVDVNHAVNGVDSKRHVTFAGSTASASYDGKQTSLGLGLTHRAQVCSGFAVLPGLSVRYRQVHLDGYTETGAGAYDLTVQSRSDNSLLWQARLGMEVGLGRYGTLLANLGAGYDTLQAASATATLDAGTGPTFISQGAKPESTVLNAGVGYRYVTARGFEINALYEREDRDTFTADTASLKFRLPF